MTDRELEQRLRAFYADEVGATEAAPADLRAELATIPLTTPTPLLRPISRRRGFTLLGIAAVLALGGAAAVGAGLVRFSPVVPPVPSNALVTSTAPSPADTPAANEPETPTPAANLRPGGLIAFIRGVSVPNGTTTSPSGQLCRSTYKTCTIPRVWVVGTDGSSPHQVVPGGVDRQSSPIWASDGTHMLFSGDGKFYLVDVNGGDPQAADTGCVAPCFSDADAAVSRDGTHLVFVRTHMDDIGAIATMDLTTGRIAELRATAPSGAMPGWSPDGRRIVFFRYGEKDSGGPVPPVKGAVFVVDADGQNLHQISPTTLEAGSGSWSPDGARILFTTPQEGQQDIYTVRPDGSDMRRLTSDGISYGASWTPDGRILFDRATGASGTGPPPDWWTMRADGTEQARLLTGGVTGATPGTSIWTEAAWQPIGGAPIVAPPWTPVTAVAVGPAAPGPSPTPIPDLAPGFSWTGSPSVTNEGFSAHTATLLANGRVLFAGGCAAAAQLYDPATGTFSSTGSLSQVRAAGTATLLHDGRVLFAGGSPCAGQDGMWASAELYDPATGTFSPTGSMAAPRQQHTATLLADGRVLIAGGLSGPSAATAGAITLASYQTAETDSFLTSAEIYDPATGAFQKTGSMATPHRGHTATLLQDGHVLVVGNGGESSRSGTAADLYDSTSGTWSKTGPMKIGRWLHTATLLLDGRVLIVGGRSPQDSVYTSTELYDPRTRKFSMTGSMSEGRQQQSATLLADGRVFIAGGYWSDGQQGRVLSSTEMYDPATGTFRPIGSMGAPRDGHTATLLPGGRVLIVGGGEIGSQGGFAVTPAVLFQP